MPSLESRLNPQVVVILNKIKSGEYLNLFKAKLIQIKWILLGIVIIFVLLLAIVIGRRLSQKNSPIFVPPIIDISTPTTVPQKTSVFDSLKRSVQTFNPQLPDPVIPVFDNNINLEKSQ